MPVNDFSVGNDTSITVVTSKGTLRFTGLTDFTADPMTTELKSKRISGKPKFGVIPDGWKGSFKLDRVDSEVDDYWAQVEADYYAGVNNPASTITQIVRELSGKVSEYRYTGVVLRMDKAGDWGGDKKVEQSVSFDAEQRIKVS